jgi:protein-L-isoaspartate(D-aspartate) O-methyltransferase
MSTLGYLSHSISREKLVDYLNQKGIVDSTVLEAFKNTPRHRFVDGAFRESAYNDCTFPIGEGQTISQPYIVALMTQTLDIKPGMRILEIGTGSGFQTAILASFTKQLFSVERFTSLSFKARKLLSELGYANIVFKVGDGTLGWQDHAPFDRIIVTAGAPSVPSQLLKQLAPNGKLLIPAGDRNGQHLELYHRLSDRIERRVFEDVLFVPLVGKDGWESEDE